MAKLSGNQESRSRAERRSRMSFSSRNRRRLSPHRNRAACVEPTAPAAPVPVEDKEQQPIRTLTELVKDLPLDRDSWAAVGVDMPGAEETRLAFQVQLRRMDAKMEQLRAFLEELPVCDEAYLWDSRVERQTARDALQELTDALDQLREDMFCWLVHVDHGCIVELDEAGLDAIGALRKAVPYWRGPFGRTATVALKFLATQPNRGGILACAEQARLLAWEATPGPFKRPFSRTDWPWIGLDGQPITDQSRWELGDLPKPKIPKAVRKFLAPPPPPVRAAQISLRNIDIQAIGDMLRAAPPDVAKHLRKQLPASLGILEHKNAR